MATGEDQPELVVAHSVALFDLLSVGVLIRGPGNLLLEFRAPSEASMRINRTISGCRDDPSRRILGSPIVWPPITRNNERVLDGILSQRDVTKESDQCRNSLAIRFAKHTLDLCRISMISNGARHSSVTA
jgi:hypothetical protein